MVYHNWVRSLNDPIHLQCCSFIVIQQLSSKPSNNIEEQMQIKRGATIRIRSRLLPNVLYLDYSRWINRIRQYEAMLAFHWKHIGRFIRIILPILFRSRKCSPFLYENYIQRSEFYRNFVWFLFLINYYYYRQFVVINDNWKSD